MKFIKGVQVQERLQITADQLRLAVKQKRIIAYLIGARAVRFLEVDIEKILEVRMAEEAAAEAYKRKWSERCFKQSNLAEQESAAILELFKRPAHPPGSLPLP